MYGGGVVSWVASVEGALGCAAAFSLVGRGILQMGHLLLMLRSKLRQLRHR